MSQFIQSHVADHIGTITLDRPQALNSLSLEMVRALTALLHDWRDDAHVRAVVIRGSSGKAFCAGGDIRFFHQAGSATPRGGSALLEDFFTEEYALNHLIHHFPKPYIALMDGIVMGGGMGVAQSGPASRVRIVTERTKMAMPEVNIGLFPDVGGSYFLSRCSAQIGTYLGVTGAVIGAADALFAGLADHFVPSAQLPLLQAHLAQHDAVDFRGAAAAFAAQFADQCDPAGSLLAQQRAAIAQHFSATTVPAILASLAHDATPFALATMRLMQQRSPLMMSVTLAQLRRGEELSLADCLRMERTMVRHVFAHGEVLEGVRAVVIDKDNQPHWQPATLDAVTTEMVEGFFAPIWPTHAHPLRALE